jgi:methylmalonyl-CoA mutase N-terminal domain/subunit
MKNNSHAASKKQTASPSGLPLDAVVTAPDLIGFEPERDLSFPGEFPFTRGVYPTMYRGRLWTTRQYAGFGSATESNERYRYLLAQGVKGLSVAFDLPTQIGMDSDHALALGEVGKVGVAIDSLEDMQTLFNGIPLENVSTSMTINSTASILLALYVAVAKQQGANLQRLAGTVQNDILKEYIARGTYIYPLRCASSPTFLRGAAQKFPTGMRFRFPAITSAKPARPTCRK